MKTEYRIPGIVALFLFGTTAVYGWWTANANPDGRIEWIGMLALLLSALLCLMLASFFYFVSRRIDLRPEDRPDADISEGAGEVGFFSPGSYWPFGVALAALITGVGLAFVQSWLIILGLLAVVVAAGGLVFEYYTGARRGAH